MGAGPELLEKEAYSFLSESNFEEAFRLFRKAALNYTKEGNNRQSTLCFASAASCWNKKNQEKTFHNAASSYESAARQAEKYGDLEYASLLYKHAAINHERDLEFLNFSNCFYRSKECYRKFLTYSLINPGRIRTITSTGERSGIIGFFRRIFLWFIMTFSFIIWGHGERPARTFFGGILIIAVSSALYLFGHLFKGGIPYRPDFFDAFYFSVITFTTVGYGDFTPLGLNKAVAAIEAFTGLFIMSLFVIGLTRKYLRF